LYEAIRENGGWDNWKMEIINFFECKDQYEARKKEQEYFISLNANLNSIEPFPKQNIKVIIPPMQKEEKKIYFCKTCNIFCNSSKLLEEHNKKNKHLKKLDNLSIILQDNNKIIRTVYKCEICRIITTNKKDYNKHISTAKHKKLILLNPELIGERPKHICMVCLKEYQSNVGLWKHKKLCSLKEDIIENNVARNNTMENKEKKLIELLIKENMDFKKIVFEFMKTTSEIQTQFIEVYKNKDNSI